MIKNSLHGQKLVLDSFTTANPSPIDHAASHSPKHLGAPHLHIKHFGEAESQGKVSVVRSNLVS